MCLRSLGSEVEKGCIRLAVSFAWRNLRDSQDQALYSVDQVLGMDCGVYGVCHGASAGFVKFIWSTTFSLDVFAEVCRIVRSMGVWH